jgi:LacI family transcriptional regulator
MLMQGSLRALAEAGIRLGPEMSFVGCDDVAVAEFHHPPIAVVHRDVQAIGEASAELLLMALDERHDDPVEDVTLPTEFLDRPSCAPPAEKPRQARRRARKPLATERAA